jgi:protein-tyrosine-phosphatase
MNVDLTDERERRAGKHAALSDAARLHVVDLLTDGDRSPTELQAALGIGSNLLSHHLNVLERSGLIARTRSEADRRRSYVRLVRTALDELRLGPVPTAKRVVFVCTANSARSQLAAAIWERASAIPVASAGTHPAPAVDPGAIGAARRHQLPFAPSVPTGLDAVRFDRDLVITVCDHAHEELRRADALHWSVPDPVAAGTDTAFDAAFDDLARRIGDFAPRMAPTQAAPA